MRAILLKSAWGMVAGVALSAPVAALSSDGDTAPPPAVAIGTPKFTAGEVPLLTKNLERHVAKVAKCVSDHGGLTKAKGGIDVQFLVRARGRAEGVEVLRHRGVAAEAAKCVQKLLKNRWVGAPSEDPVGVELRFQLKRR